jgi:hypothetical protein
MKKIKSHIVKIILLVLIGMGACTDKFEEINTNPNAFNEVAPETLLAGAIKNSLDLIGGEMNLWYGYHNARYAGSTGGHASLGFWTTTTNNDGYWNRLFVLILNNTQRVLVEYGDDPLYKNRVELAKIWQSYVYSVIVGAYGPVPYDEAFNGSPAVAYNSEEEIYTGILTQLKESSEAITLDGDYLTMDPLFNGDNSKWIKFANTLRLKIALRCSSGFPDLALKHVGEVMANEDGLINSNADNVVQHWGEDEENWSFFYKQFVNLGQNYIPKMNHMFMLYMKSYYDPRVSVYAAPAELPYLFTDTLGVSASDPTHVAVQYYVPYLGAPLAGSKTPDEWDMQNEKNPLSNLDVERNYSFYNSSYFEADASYNLIIAAETSFMKAEAALRGWGGSKSAEMYYNEGIDLSFEQLGLSAGSATYKSRDGIKWGTESEGHLNFCSIASSSIANDPMEKIMVQRWLATFNQGLDAWFLQKRTRAFDWPPHFKANQLTGKKYVDNMERVIYATNELSLNGVHYNYALQNYLQGDDHTLTRLQTSVVYEPIDYTDPSTKGEFTYDFVSEFYGKTIDNLKLAGLVERVIAPSQNDPLKANEYYIIP